jgi:hypothetical protein
MLPVTAAQRATLMGSRVERFRYELHRLVNGVWTIVDPDLQLVRECNIIQNRYQRIKRTATFQIIDSPTIDFLQDRVRVFHRVRAAAVGAAEHEFKMGTFWLVAPDAPLTKTGRLRSITGYDSLWAVDAFKMVDWLTLPAADNVVGTVINLLHDAFPHAGVLIPLSTLTFGEPKVFEAGMSLLDVVNRMLAYAGYTSLRANNDGSFLSDPYVAPSARASEFTYDEAADHPFVADLGVLSATVFDAPNRFVRTVSQPGRGAPYPLRSQYDLPAGNPLSAARRGFVIANYAPVDVVDQAALDALTKIEAEEDQLNRHKLRVPTALMPSDWADVVTLNWTRLPPSEPQGAKWIEESWTFPCVPGGVMDHVFARAETTT